MKTCVIGLGKIGLPLAVQFAKNGMDVVGVDINAQTVELKSALGTLKVAEAVIKSSKINKVINL